jgi:hypothetical protein
MRRVEKILPLLGLGIEIMPEKTFSII